MLSRSTKGHGSRRFGFPSDWEVTIVDKKGKVAFDTIPADTVGYVYRKGDDFMEEEGFDPDYLKHADDKLRFLKDTFGHAIEVDGYFFVSEDGDALMRAVSEWGSRGQRMPAEQIGGYKLSPGCREIIAVAMSEPGAVRSDLAAYVLAYTAWNNRTDPADNLYDGLFGYVRGLVSMDPGSYAGFVYAELTEAAPENDYERRIMAVAGADGPSASEAGRYGSGSRRSAKGKTSKRSGRAR